ncbi:MAG: nitroreductase family deazaflavin-dependent oxidoreductase [Chloroflexi bacterium]|nr:nitroreductase family deazaflavin-dependent oxidoreductase [Chloroflexota bacterium]
MSSTPATTSTALPYPAGLVRTLLRAPLLLYRMGLGDALNAIHILVLVTRGRTSGLPRFTPIEYRRHGSKIYLVSGWGTRPNWLQNLLANPLATVQLGSHAQAARAQLVTDPAESLRALYLFRRTAPGRYDTVLSYVIDESVSSKTLPNLSSQFTIVRLDLTSELPLLPGVPRDLTWLPPLLLAGLVTLLVLPRRRKG